MVVLILKNKMALAMGVAMLLRTAHHMSCLHPLTSVTSRSDHRPGITSSQTGITGDQRQGHVA